MYKYILFDFDGTLIDTNDLITLTLNETSKRYLNRELSHSELNSILGRHLEDQMKLLSPSDYSRLMLFYKDFYRSNQDTMVKEFPGVRKMLDDIKSLGCKMAIVSAKGRGGIEHGLKLFQMEHYFDVIISAYDIQNNKPHAEPALKALRAFNAQPDNALLVGDSYYDILCGKNARIKTVLVDWTIFPREQILKTGPDFIIKEPADLVKIVSSEA